MKQSSYEQMHHKKKLSCVQRNFPSLYGGKKSALSSCYNPSK